MTLYIQKQNLEIIPQFKFVYHDEIHPNGVFLLHDGGGIVDGGVGWGHGEGTARRDKI